uniref:F-box domain-containing protein n=1 Tax=Parascaris univalens TaxID=6257 RepID=A0A915CAY1_PARUN
MEVGDEEGTATVSCESEQADINDGYGNSDSGPPVGVGNTFQAAFSVTSRIFRCMSARELLNAKLVCKSWNHAIEQILMRRCKVVGFFHEALPAKSGRACPDTSLGAYLKKVSIVPSLVFALQCTRARSCLVGRHTRSKCPLRDSLPSKCRLLGGVAHDGIYGWSGESEGKEGVLKCGCVNEAIAGFIFSSGLLSRSDVHIHSIAVTDTVEQMVYSLSPAKKNKDSFCSLFSLPREEEIKCVILIGRESSSQQLEKQLCNWLLNLQPQGPDIALCGGALSFVREEHVIEQDDVSPVVGRRFWKEQRYKFVHMVGLLFGGSGVRASSFVIPPHIRKEELIKEYLLEWKNSVIDTWPCTSNRIAFLFSCCGRQTHVNEAYVFRCVFPNIPICGLRTYGEYGMNVPAQPLKRLNGSDSRKRPHVGNDDEREVLLTFNAVYAVISID